MILAMPTEIREACNTSVSPEHLICRCHRFDSIGSSFSLFVLYNDLFDLFTGKKYVHLGEVQKRI